MSPEPGTDSFLQIGRGNSPSLPHPRPTFFPSPSFPFQRRSRRMRGRPRISCHAPANAIGMHNTKRDGDSFATMKLRSTCNH